MKKLIIIVLSIFIFSSSVKAATFHLSDPIDGVYLIMDKGTSKSFQKFKAVYKNDTNELVYCVEPGVKLSSEEYLGYTGYNELFYIDQAKMDKVKLIAYYGYLYDNHTDFSWYIATQYMIWDTVKSRYWSIYFTDENKNMIDNPYINQINEINRLIENHKSKPSIYSYYEFNYNDEIKIYDDDKLISNYESDNLMIDGNSIFISKTLKPGTYEYKLNLKNQKKGLFYNHPTGQDLYEKGNIYDDNISFKVHITSGNITINECLEEDFTKYFIGGTYEVLDQDDEVIDEITCTKDKECKSSALPTGYFKIRVKSLNSDFEENKYIYDVLINDNETSNINICSLKKKVEEVKKEVILIDDEEEYDEIYMPSTYKSNITSLSISLLLLITSFKGGMRYKNI